jgi:hypothetical protein
MFLDAVKIIEKKKTFDKLTNKIRNLTDFRLLIHVYPLFVSVYLSFSWKKIPDKNISNRYKKSYRHPFKTK